MIELVYQLQLFNKKIITSFKTREKCIYNAITPNGIMYIFRKYSMYGFSSSTVLCFVTKSVEVTLVIQCTEGHVTL